MFCCGVQRLGGKKRTLGLETNQIERGMNMTKATLLLLLIAIDAAWGTIALPWFINQGWALLFAGLATSWGLVVFNIKAMQRLFTTKEISE